MPSTRTAIIDTNFIQRAYKVDPSCDLLELICDAYSAQGIVDHAQVAKISYCDNLTERFADHRVTDEQVAEFMLSYQGQFKLDRVVRDPVDLKLVVFAMQHIENCTFLTCEARLLELSEQQGIGRACFKAALHQLDEQIGGLFDGATYQTDAMFIPLEDIETSRRDPFFHYSLALRCPPCHPSSHCKTHRKPPRNPTP